jgi:hypothetical protein
MPIIFACTCGKTLRVPDVHAGRRAKCPACNAVVNIPAPGPDFEIIEDAQKPVPRSSSKRPAKPVIDDDSDDGTYRLGPPEPTLDDPTGRRPRGKPGLH